MIFEFVCYRNLLLSATIDATLILHLKSYSRAHTNNETSNMGHKNRGIYRTPTLPYISLF